MADTTNLSKFLTDVADAIRTKRETTEAIPASEFDSEILQIETGIDTSDATATADDILQGTTAYIAEGKVEGNIAATYDTASPAAMSRAVNKSSLSLLDWNLNANVACETKDGYLNMYKMNETAINTTQTIHQWRNPNASYLYNPGHERFATPVIIRDGIDYAKYYISFRFDYTSSESCVGVEASLISEATGTKSSTIRGYIKDRKEIGSLEPYVTPIPNDNQNILVPICLRLGASGDKSMWLYSIKFAEDNSSYTYHQLHRTWFSSTTYDSRTTTNSLAQSFTQITPDKKHFLTIFKNGTSGDTNGFYFRTIGKLASDYTSVQVLDETSLVGSNHNDLVGYVFVSNDLIWIGDKIYNIVDLTNPIGNAPYKLNLTAQGEILGNRVFVTDYGSNTMKIYILEGNALTFDTQKDITANSLRLGINSITYINSNNNITGYELTDKGNLIAMTRADAVFYDTSSASTTETADILQGKAVFTADGKIYGTMPDNGAINITPSTEDQTIPEGYTSGGTVAGDADLIAENIKEGVDIFGVTGTLQEGMMTQEEYDQAITDMTTLMGGTEYPIVDGDKLVLNVTNATVEGTTLITEVVE